VWVGADGIRTRGDEAAAGDVKAKGIDRGQSMPSRKLDNQVAMNDRLAAGHDQAATRGARKVGYGMLDLGRVTHIYRDDFHAERRGPGPGCGEPAGATRVGGISKERRAAHAGGRGVEQ